MMTRAVRDAANDEAVGILVQPPAEAEQRAAPRQRTLYALGRLLVAGGQRVCTVRNLSPGGVGIELDAPPPVGTAVQIETRGLPLRAAEVCWVSDRAVGLTFVDTPAEELVRAAEATPRSPRFGYEGPVELVTGAGLSECRAIDLGLGGIRVAGALPGAPGDALEVVIDAMLAVRGRLAWDRGDSFAIEFAAPLSTRQLAGAIARWEATLTR
ncbi:PilZ domain-containing protein [Sphingomonas sp. BK235]|uniref:PilZ domain-containing protein n=1 Tax=Sphingomonas sp. BK235 TaxID=2512131 RepID=UPI00104D07AA|nr:PilZ domain-containing protein [Sphingomonas sp. BK235]TCP34768.1 PilZ domain-containing protein [Sphingomonas sp. BK235]